MRYLILAALVALCAFAGMVPAKADPIGYRIACAIARSQPDSPQARYVCDKTGGTAQIVATEQTLTAIKQVNQRVNRLIRPRADPANTDRWSVGVRAGDCEDFAIAKRKLLIDAGFPRSALRFRWGQLQDGQYHVILAVKTDRGIFVLDNRIRNVRRLKETPYRNWRVLS